MIIEIDPSAGFCFGVNNAITLAEQELKKGFICSLGSIVHNSEEVGRLEKSGMRTISHQDISIIKGEKVLIRTHGESPETFESIKENQLEFIDATCPIVSKLQERIKKSSEVARGRLSQVLIFGKRDHAEVIGLVGHSGHFAKVVEKEKDLETVDFDRPIELYAQTTMTPEGLENISLAIKNKIKQHGGNADDLLRVYNTICGQVSGREKSLRNFASKFELILFVSGKESSNGNRLFQYCKEENTNSHFISHPSEFKPEWLKGVNSIGISGATSTPEWLMQQVRSEIQAIL